MSSADPTARLGPDLPPDVEEAADAILLGPAAELSGSFEALCAAHPEHRLALERLRTDFERAARLLDDTGSPARLPDAIGPYRFVRQIGEGAFGVVFLAEQREPIRRQVAIKLLHANVASSSAVQRFEVERETLARMSHPAIARIFDAGVDAGGRPYFVMEYVPGEPLHAHVQRCSPSVPERLRLFVEACEGVSHAHQRGVIHRDLKPQNILIAEVDGRAVPKVIDFGLAKVLSDEAVRDATHTVAGVVLGTPAYMSPEQVRGDARDVDTRTDVYSLGVILYEILADALPFDAERYRSATLTELQRLIHDVEPPLVSVRATRNGAAHASRLRGDLDWVLRKAMAKERNERYGSVAEFAADLRRHLAHQPVAAGPPSVSYVLRKFVRRHRAQVVAAGLVLAALLLGLVVSVQLWRESRANERRASANLADFWRLADVVELETLLAEEKDLWPSSPARLADHERWLDRANGLLARRAQHARTVDELAGELASDGRTDWSADEARGARFLHDRLGALVAALDEFARDGGTLQDVAARAAFARSVQDASIDRVRSSWDRAIETVRSSPRYGGLELEPILGLLPLGPDPDSGLEEFAHLQSGSTPSRGKDGHLLLEDDTGIVLVLVPGGRVAIGSQGDPRAPHFDPHRQVVEHEYERLSIEPFLIAKYELTQAQARKVGIDTSVQRQADITAQFRMPFAPRVPVTFVLASELRHALAHFELRLPWTAEWEVAARAGSGSVWITGDEVASLQGHANVADATWGEQEDPIRPWDDRVRDGFVFEAPVGSFAPNAYGLHDVLGNVAELTEIEQSGGTMPGALARGGSFMLVPLECRVGSVRWAGPTQNTPELGVRVARNLSTGT